MTDATDQALTVMVVIWKLEHALLYICAENKVQICYGIGEEDDKVLKDIPGSYIRGRTNDGL